MAGDRVDKTERLLNLTLALIATRRPLRKSEIFETIPGYSGSPESMERMFERDKDELREMGVSVQVLPIDPLFDDEIGYQVISQDYFMPDLNLTREESIWLAIATAVLNESSSSINTNGALQKLLSGNEIPIEEILDYTHSWNLQLPLNDSLMTIWQALKERSSLAFNYSTSTNQRMRRVSPHSLTSRNGYWYLVAIDHEDLKIKTFRIDRISEIEPDRKVPFTEPPESFDLSSFLRSFSGERIREVKIKLHREMSPMHPLVARATHSISDYTLPVGSELVLQNIDRSELLDQILWAGDAVEVLEPTDIRDEIISLLEKIIEQHL